MTDDNDKNPIVAIAAVGAAGSTAIAFLAFMLLHTITDLGMFAVAIAVAAPGAMALGIACTLIKHGKTQSGRPSSDTLNG